MTLPLKHPHADAYALNGGTVYTPYAYLATEKRFTTAELLAQYWFCENMGHSPIFTAQLYRFACLPHYDHETP
ncbi:hypothetical protein ArV2_gp62 [Arthrobacter phage vB_ArS-ArV2]|uniref:Uncharacterized protein n=1 Tax=Arthrobacter phage vB_ArS-ArV2 TaxID=1414742 RepID=V5R929_9CAUD|nr:hypothetical protein ArV2_gp62 [Arthrobacter phage vB_ArS-ArV2]AHB31673.1 hypothetical protein ArV2_gp62 [Arthrobacter phage vB_ArS-ArV2]